jgi:hypothetical protein
VAMVLRFDSEDGQLFFFDSTANGVQISRWSRFRLFFSDVYEHIFVRHLYCERDEAFLNAMEKFIKTTVGNSYNLSLTQLLFRKKTVKGK